MTIRPIAEMPDDFINENQVIISFQLQRVTPSISSPFSGFVKRGNPLDTRWFVDIDMPQRSPEGVDDLENGWIQWDNFIDSIDGSAGRFTMWNPLKALPQGVATGIGRERTTVTWAEDDTFWTDNTNAFAPGGTDGLVNGGFKRGSNTISIYGMRPNEELSLKAGDNFSIEHGPERIPALYKVMANASSDAMGVTNVSIKPLLRYGTAHNSIVSFYRPRSVFQFVQDPQIVVSQGLQGQSGFQAIEIPEVLDEPVRLSQFGGFS